MNTSNNQKNLVKFIFCAVVFLIAYIPTFVWMWERWFAKESYYGHGILIPLVSFYVFWQRRSLLKTINISSSGWGLFIIAAGLVVHIVCALLKIYFLSGFSLVLVLYGLVLFFFGKEISGKLIFPIFFLLAMIPLPLVLISNLTVKLKLYAAHMATFTLNKIGFPSILDGSIIRMPNSFTNVGAPCSGLRSLISLLTLGIIFSFFMKTSYIKKVLLLISAVPIAIVTNVMRITMISIVNDLYGEKVALGFFHDFSGFLVFAFAFCGLFVVGRILEPNRDENEK
ncbi:exosortase/archaeosortase family protein [Candidatus Omnitrophota bacterium]